MAQPAKKPKIPAITPEVIPAAPEIADGADDFGLLIVAAGLGVLAIYLIHRKRVARELRDVLSSPYLPESEQEKPILDQVMSGFRP